MEESFINLDCIKEEPMYIKEEIMDECGKSNMEFLYNTTTSNNVAFQSNLKTEPLEMDCIFGSEYRKQIIAPMATTEKLKSRENYTRQNLTPMKTAELLKTTEQARNSESRKRNLTPMATVDMLKKTQQLNKMQDEAKLPKLPTLAITKKKLPMLPTEAQLLKGMPIKRLPTLPKSSDQQQADKFALTVSNNVNSSEKQNSFSIIATEANANLSNTAKTFSDNQTSDLQIKSCALLQFFSFENTYMINCFYCETSYKLCNWEKFITHLETKHITEMNFNAFLDDSNCRKIVQSNPLPTESNIITKKLPVKPQSLPFSKNEDENLLYDNLQTDSYENSLSLNFNKMDDDVDFINKHKTDCQSNVNLEFENQQNCEKVINFETSNENKILRFLKVLTLHPMLWQKRRHGPSKWDMKAEIFLRDFDPDMSIIDLRKSLDNARTLHRHFKQAKYQIEKTYKLQQYGKLLNEISTQSKSFIFECTHCEEYFYDGNNLLTHEFVQHKIEHFPYKCKSCDIHFSSNEAMQKHVRLHALKQPNTCKYCNMTFKKVRAHLSRKHPDCIEIRLPFKCEKCNKRFKSRNLRSQHSLKHD